MHNIVAGASHWVRFTSTSLYNLSNSVYFIKKYKAFCVHQLVSLIYQTESVRTTRGGVPSEILLSLRLPNLRVIELAMALGERAESGNVIICQSCCSLEEQSSTLIWTTSSLRFISPFGPPAIPKCCKKVARTVLRVFQRRTMHGEIWIASFKNNNNNNSGTYAQVSSLSSPCGSKVQIL